MSNFEIKKLENCSAAELKDHYISEKNRFSEYIYGLGDNVEQLKAEEQAIIALAEDYDKRMNEHKGYPLPDDVMFSINGAPEVAYSKAKVATKIRKFLEKQGVEFSLTLGYLQIYEFWNAPKSRINHKVMDATLKILGQQGVKFEGPKEWESILIIDRYFKPISEDYSKNVLEQRFYVDMHSIILDALQMQTPGAVNEA